MKTTNAFKLYNRNKFYSSIKNRTKELNFNPVYLANEKDRTNFGNKLDWEGKTREVESLLSKNGLEVYLTDIFGSPILDSNGNKIFKTKRIKKSKNDIALYSNIKNYYESNNKFFDFVRKKKLTTNPVYEIIEYFFTDLYVNLSLLSTKQVNSVLNSTVDLHIDIFSKKNKINLTFSELNLNVYVTSTRECVINGGKPPTNNFAYMLLGGKPNSENPITIEEWCRVNQPQSY